MFNESFKPQKPIWVTGAAGLIGHALVEALQRRKLPVYPVTRQEIDLTRCDQIVEQFTEHSPSAIIHCAAISDTTQCQQNQNLARKVNLFATRFLCDIASDIPLIFFSTDLVFDGQKGNYSPEDPVNPLNFYAETKAEAEQYILLNPLHTVIRTSLNGGISPKGNRGFNEQIRQAWVQGKELTLFTDEFRNPIPASITAELTLQILSNQLTGIAHIAGGSKLSRWQIGELLARRWGNEITPRMKSGTLKEYNGPKRPADTSLDITQTEELLNEKIPGLEQWLLANPEIPF